MAAASTDYCEIIGSTGKISFSFFKSTGIELVTNVTTTQFDFSAMQHVQLTIIAHTVQYFFDEAHNPCTAEEGSEIMRWIERFSAE